MNWQWELDRAILPIKRSIARTLGPDPSRLGHPLFSDRVKDRWHRWVTERQPNAYAAVASKTNGQAFMRSLGYAVPEVYGTYPSLHAIPRFEDLPPSFVLKPTRGSSGAGVFLMREGFDLIRKRSFTRDAIISTAMAFNGPGMQGIAGPWVTEELLFNFDSKDEPALDYKFFCFGPRVVMIQINQRTGLANPFYRIWFRDPDWQPLAFRVNWDKFPQRSALPRPPCLDDMLKIVSDVAGRLNIFVRVDMFATDRGPVFGEFTAYPHAGKGYTPRGDAWLGSLWTTPDGGI